MYDGGKGFHLIKWNQKLKKKGWMNNVKKFEQKICGGKW
jgi:hypothetical protein